jgi:magnesium transporter
VTDPEEHLLGVLSLHKIVLTRPETPVRELVFRDPITVRVDTDQAAAAKILTERNLLALPVVDFDGRIVGIITADDVADVLEKEATEDIERLGGSQPVEEPYLRASPQLLFRKRIVWLLVLFCAQFITVSILGHYEDLVAEATVSLIDGTGLIIYFTLARTILQLGD